MCGEAGGKADVDSWLAAGLTSSLAGQRRLPAVTTMPRCSTAQQQQQQQRAVLHNSSQQPPLRLLKPHTAPLDPPGCWSPQPAAQAGWAAALCLFALHV